ncbi:MAG: hypothetical protein FJ263_00755 [Planctomycetes bacterium]|nr:hypothetical protein [Planctomycetota bacterium]
MSDIYMSVKKIQEAGYKPALVGLAHNKKQSPEKMSLVAEKLADKDGGHNKFLESLVVWLDVRAPRYFWQEADTFRLSTKQSESTMHTLTGELLTIDISDGKSAARFLEENFEPESCTAQTLRWIYDAAKAGDLVAVKKRLPEGFLQARMWCMNYKTLRNIILQRRTHRLPHWKEFIRQTLEQVEHPELLPELSLRMARLENSAPI